MQDSVNGTLKVLKSVDHFHTWYPDSPDDLQECGDDQNVDKAFILWVERVMGQTSDK